MTRRRVVVTGLGMISPLGIGVETSWQKIVAGESGIRLITDFDTTEYPVKFAGTVLGFDPEVAIAKKDVKKMDVCLQYGIVAAREAWLDSGLSVTEESAWRMGVGIGSGIGGLTTLSEGAVLLDKIGPKRLSPFFIPASIINMISGHVSIAHGLKGPNIAMATACATGTHSIGYAARTIVYGDADVMLAGGAEKASCQAGIAGFAACRALSTRNENPAAASRPWDKDRDGFVLGDGAGVMVLEEYEHARARGAKIYAELTGFGLTADAYHMTLPSGEGAYRAMVHTLQDGRITADQLDYINAHATSTPPGDIVESQGIERMMGAAAHKVAVSSTKSMTGHALGAAGALEAIFSVLAIRDQVAPPTINLHHVDEGCHLDYVPNQAQARKIKTVLSNSFGFGGTNASLLFQKV